MPKQIFGLIALFALAACGGSPEGSFGGGGENTGTTVGTYTPLANTTSSENSELVLVALDNDGNVTAVSAGTLDHDTGAITGGALAGTVVANFTEIDLTGPGFATLSNPSNTEYVRVFFTQGTADDIFGVFGQPTIGGDIPTDGTGLFSGKTSLTVAAGDTLYVLNGNLNLTANWDAGQIDTTLLSLSGTKTESGTSINVSNPGTITIDNANLNAATGAFSGGSASTTGSDFALSGGQSISGTQGQFFGPNADEVGGTININDPANGFSAIGVYSGE